MRRSLQLGLASAVLATAALTGCKGQTMCSESMPTASEAPRDSANGNAGRNAGTAPSAASEANASRAIAEADIVQLDDAQGRLYAMSRSGSLAIVGTKEEGKLTLSGKTALPGEPFEMYRRGDVLLTMSNHAVAGDGKTKAPLAEGAAMPPEDARASALVQAIDVSNPAAMKAVANLSVAGEIADSRIVGSVLYLATYENAQCWQCTTKPRTLVTTFDIRDPLAPKQIDQIEFDSPAVGGFNAAWSTPWKRSIVATKDRLYVGGLSKAPAGTTTPEGVIEVIDITDPTGHLTRGATIATSGPVMSRWQMDEADGVLRVVSQRGAGRTSNGEKFPEIETFRIESTSSITPLGHSTMKLPRQEGLKTVRFDGIRAYAITFNQTDPLFTIDLKDAAHPEQKGELLMPGWMFHLEPRGDQVIGLGLDRTDKQGNLNVSLFDVKDMSAPKLVKRIPFGPTNLYEDYQITNGVLAEDQDRIQKAFRVFDDGLIAVPFSGTNTCADATAQTPGAVGGIQLVDWANGSLTKRAFLPVTGNARRALRPSGQGRHDLIALSDSHVRAFSIEQRDVAKQTADLVIGVCTARTTPGGGWGNGGGWEGGDDWNGGKSDGTSRDGTGSCF